MRFRGKEVGIENDVHIRFRVVLQNCIGDVIQWTHGYYNLVRSQFFAGRDKGHRKQNPYNL
jgi:hypothetical protein